MLQYFPSRLNSRKVQSWTLTFYFLMFSVILNPTRNVIGLYKFLFQSNPNKLQNLISIILAKFLCCLITDMLIRKWSADVSPNHTLEVAMYQSPTCNQNNQAKKQWTVDCSLFDGLLSNKTFLAQNPTSSTLQALITAKQTIVLVEHVYLDVTKVVIAKHSPS